MISFYHILNMHTNTNIRSIESLRIQLNQMIELENLAPTFLEQTIFVQRN